MRQSHCVETAMAERKRRSSRVYISLPIVMITRPLPDILNMPLATSFPLETSTGSTGIQQSAHDGNCELDDKYTRRPAHYSTEVAYYWTTAPKPLLCSRQWRRQEGHKSYWAGLGVYRRRLSTYSRRQTLYRLK